MLSSWWAFFRSDLVVAIPPADKFLSICKKLHFFSLFFYILNPLSDVVPLVDFMYDLFSYISILWNLATHDLEALILKLIFLLSAIRWCRGNMSWKEFPFYDTESWNRELSLERTRCKKLFWVSAYFQSVIIA